MLPTRRERLPPPPIDPKVVTKIALRLKHQIEQVIPCELDEESVVKPHSPVITNDVLETAKLAGGEEHRACVVFCLLVVKKWFKVGACTCYCDDSELTIRRANLTLSCGTPTSIMCALWLLK